jgi:tRNA threonylcarbamoyl adenosine modification protein YeaZ
LRTLVIDCATEACSVALFEAGELIAGEYADLGRGHAERLVPMIAALPGNGQADRIAVNSGPGSFTGIRVGLAAARALALPWNAAVSGYSSLALVAAMACRTQPGMALDVVMTGGHGEWFLQSFGSDGAPLAELVSLAPEAAASASHAQLVAGSQAEALARLRGDAQVTALMQLPDARAFGLLSQAALTADPVATYGRAPDARLPSV